jgi:hypothetical protein
MGLDPKISFLRHLNRKKGGGTGREHIFTTVNFEVLVDEQEG